MNGTNTTWMVRVNIEKAKAKMASMHATGQIMDIDNINEEIMEEIIRESWEVIDEEQLG